MSDIYVGVDGGNSKTEIALSDSSGRVLHIVRGPGCSPDKLGYEAAATVVADLVAEALEQVSQPHRLRSLCAYVAGLDLPEHLVEFEKHLSVLFADVNVLVGNDTLAVLLAGTGGLPGIVLVCGAGINGMCRDEHGNSHGFLSLGQLTGDWGGGISLGREVLFHAVRVEDGRGQATQLLPEVISHFEAESATAVALGIHRGFLQEPELAGLVPGLFRAARANDQAALDIIDRVADELLRMIEALIDRAELAGSEIPIILAGGVLTSPDSPVAQGLEERLGQALPSLHVEQLGVRPVAGALIGALEAGHGQDPAAPSLNLVRRAVLDSELLSEDPRAAARDGERCQIGVGD